MCYPGIPTGAYVIPLGTDYDAPDAFALVSPEDYDLACSYRWWAVDVDGAGDDRRLYAYGNLISGRSQPRDRAALHRLVAETAYGPCPEGLWVDHVNGDSLDCRRSNLRYVTPRQNKLNWHKEITPENVWDVRRRIAREATAGGGLSMDVPADPCALSPLRDYRARAGASIDPNSQRQQVLRRRRANLSTQKGQNWSAGQNGWCAVMAAETESPQEWLCDYGKRAMDDVYRFLDRADAAERDGYLRQAHALRARAEDARKQAQWALNRLSELTDPRLQLALFAVEPSPERRAA